jgi:hypothetical protein
MAGLLWEFQQQRGITAASSSAAKAGSKATQAQIQVRQLEDRLDKLSLICMAMWQLLSEQTALTEEQLMARIAEIDLQDGKADGKVSKTVAQCRQCGRVMSRTHSSCMYCGTDKLELGPFDRVL